MPAEDDAREPRSCGGCGWLMLYTGRITPARRPDARPRAIASGPTEGGDPE